MDVLWAPWRIDYIKSPKKDSGCVFCEKLNGSKDRENLLLYRSRHNFVVMNPYPYNNGHLMVLPNRHVPTLEVLSDEVLLDFMKTLQLSIDVLKGVLSPEGFNTGINIGKVAGAGLGEHVHMHIVPRWAGDASFMTVIGETRVIPEHLNSTYDSLYPLFKKRKDSLCIDCI